MRKIVSSGKNFLLYMLFAIAITGICYYMIIGKSLDIKYTTINDNEKIVSTVSDKINSYIQENIKLSKILGQSYVYMRQEGIDEKTTSEVLKNVLKNHTDVLYTSIINKNGDIVFYVDERIKESVENPVYNVSKYDFFKNALEGEYDARYVNTQIDGFEDMIIITSPFNEKGDIVSIGLELSTLNKIINEHSKENEYISIIDDNKNIVVHPKKEKANEVLGHADYIEDIIDRADTHDIQTDEYVSLVDNNIKLFSYERVENTPWIIIQIKAVSHVYMPIFKNIFINICTLVILIFIIYLIFKACFFKLKREEDFLVYNMERMNMLSNLSVGIAHKIRNPLSTIKAFLQMSAYSNNTDLCKIAMNDLNKIEIILDQYLKLSRPVKLDVSDCYPHEIIEDIGTILEAIGLLKDIEIDYCVNETYKLVKFPKDYLRFVVLDIIEMISEYCEKKSTLSISIKEQNKYTQISINSYLRDDIENIDNRYDFNMIKKILNIYGGKIKLIKEKNKNMILIYIQN